MKIVRLSFLFFVFAFLAAAPQEKVMILSWGDIVGNERFKGVAQLDTPERAAEAAKNWKAHGVRKVIFRVDDFRLLLFHKLHYKPGGDYSLWAETTRRAWDSGVVPAAVQAAKKEGLEIQMWISVFDDGCPPEVLYQDSRPFPWQSNFSRENPQFLSCDRSLTPSGRRYQYGQLEYAYPEVRQYMVKMVTHFSDSIPFDGVFISIRTHTPPPDFADQYGYNEPIVNEYQRRYGKNILRQSFDLEKWRELRGEYFTMFLRELKAHLRERLQTLSVGVAQGEHMGPPFGNMVMQWRRWVEEKIVDELVVGHHTNERATYPYRTQRTMGYVQDQDEGIGLPPIEQSLGEAYGPLCLQSGVKLYVDLPLGNFHRVFDDITLRYDGQERAEDEKQFIQALESIPGVTGYVVDGRPLSSPVTETRKK